MSVCVSINLNKPSKKTFLDHQHQLPSFRPSVRKFSRNWLVCFFLKLSMVFLAHVWIYVTARLLQKLQKMMGLSCRIASLDLLENGVLTFSKNYISEKFLVFKFKVKMFLFNQIARFFGNQYLVEGITQYLRGFFYLEVVIKERYHLRLLLWVRCDQPCPAMPKLP